MQPRPRLGSYRRTRIYCSFWWALLLVTSIAARDVASQSPPVQHLRSQSAALAGSFTRVSSVRELADGRVLVTDEGENAVFLGDFGTRTITKVGGIGKGPGEYTDVGRLWPLTHDSTLMVDRGNRRWLVFAGDRIVQTIPGDQPGPRAASGTGRVLLGIAGNGEALAGSYALQLAGGVGTPGTLELTRFHRIRGGTRAGIAAPPPGSPPAPVAARPGVRLDGNGERRTGRAYNMSLSGVDQALMFPDGWVAVARANPYLIEWCPPPTSKCTPGPLLQSTTPSLRDEDRQVYLEWVSRLTNWPPTSDLAATTGWPLVIPPFIAPPNSLDQSALVGLPDGRLLIWKTPMVASREAQFDIIDRQGRLVADLRAPLNYRVVGSGVRSLYVIVADEDGIQTIQRHPLP